MEHAANATLPKPMTADTAQANCLATFAAALADCGVGHAVLSPGSRSAPLIIALGQEKSLRAHSVIDERSAGFVALGIGKASGFPSVVACTSGTAAANLAPSVHEAREAGTPMLVLTADRPPELRAAGDNQTIDQIGVYGSAAKQLIPPPFEGGAEAEWARFACEIVNEALRATPGPVHVNLPLWDPLAVSSDNAIVRPLASKVEPFTPAEEGIVDLPGGRTVIVAGRDEFGLEEGLVDVADALGIPVLADPLSPTASATSATVIRNWDSILRVRSWSGSHRPDVILRSGDLPTSKPLREWVKQSADAGTEVIHFDPLGSGRDPYKANTARHLFRLQPSLSESARGDAGWLTEWVQADAVAAKEFEAFQDASTDISEPLLFASLTALLGPMDTLFVAASMPVRDLESFGQLKGGPRSFANRGANGIDGTLATAAGHALSSGSATAVVLGDVTFAHDVSSLAAIREVTSPLLTIVVNNGGGAIFDALPIASQKEVYDKFVLTPPNLKIEAACEAWGLKHRMLRTSQDLQFLWEEAKSSTSAIVAELAVARDRSPSDRSAIRAAIAKALT